MEIWLKGSKRFQFPVIPSEYTVTSERDNETVTVNALGEVDLGRKKKAEECFFSSFFPKQYSEYCSYSNLKSPKKCVEIIEAIKNGRPAKLIITGVRSILSAVWNLILGRE